MKKLLAALMLVAMLTTVLAAPAFAAAETETVQVNFPVAGTLTNPCNGETVAYEGQQSGVLHSTLTDSGNYNFLANARVQVQGVGDMGNTYVVSANVAQHFTGGADRAQTLALNYTLRYISQGSAPNFVAHLLIHYTVNAHGEVTAEVVTFQVECRG